VVERDHGCHVFRIQPRWSGENPQWLYTSCSMASTVGADADPTVKISIDAFERIGVA